MWINLTKPRRGSWGVCRGREVVAKDHYMKPENSISYYILEYMKKTLVFWDHQFGRYMMGLSIS